MNDITIGQIAATLALCAGIIGSITAILKLVSKWLSKWHTEAMKPVMEKLDTVNSGLNSVQMEICKNYIVNFLSKVEVGDKTTSDARARFYENYDLYLKLGGNSYIHEWVDRLQKEQKV